MSETLSVIGLGKLGASMVACFASRGFDVSGYDIDKKKVENLRQGVAPVSETNLQGYISENIEHITAHDEISTLVNSSSITFIVVPTPSLDDGSFSLQYLKDVCHSLAKSLEQKDEYHLLVICSTVLPGDCRASLISLLEGYSGKKCGPDFGFCYNPEFIALGSVIQDFLNPDFCLIGEFDERSGHMLEQVFTKSCVNHAPSKRMSIEEAEITKISINSFVTMKISFANILTSLCENTKNCDVDVVCDAIGQDNRIGKKYLKGGLGFGGPCFPRDNVALEYYGRKIGSDTKLFLENHLFNERLTKDILEKCAGIVRARKERPVKKIAVLGLSYKPGSHILEKSMSRDLCKLLVAEFDNVWAYDSQLRLMSHGELPEKVIYNEDFDSCIQDADVLFICNRDTDFLRESLYHQINKAGSIVFDFWRMLDANEVRFPAVYIARGNSKLT